MESTVDMLRIQLTKNHVSNVHTEKKAEEQVWNLRPMRIKILGLAADNVAQ